MNTDIGIRVSVSISNRGIGTEVDTIFEIPVPDINGNKFTIFRPSPVVIISNVTDYKEIVCSIITQMESIKHEVGIYLDNAVHLNKR